MSTTDTREAFETTVCEIVPRPLFLLNEDGSYQEIMVQGFWKLWNAAIAHASHTPKEVSGQGCALCGNWIGHDLECKNHPVNAATEAAKATGIAGEPDEHQKFIDSLDDEDKMFEQIDRWARESYLRHKSSIRGQQITHADSERAHVIWATLRWAEQEAARQPAPVAMSDDQIILHWLDFDTWPATYNNTILQFARAIIAATNRSQP